MNKPVTHLELVPAVIDAKPAASSLDPKLITELTRAGVDAELVARVANATTTAALVDRVLISRSWTRPLRLGNRRRGGPIRWRSG